MGGDVRPGKGRRPKVPGGYPHVVRVALTTREYMLLVAAAAKDGAAPGSYAAVVVQRHLAARFEGPLPVGAREALERLVGFSGGVAALAASVDRLGRLINPVVRHLHTRGWLPRGGWADRVERELTAIRVRLGETLDAVDEAVAALRDAA